MLSINKKKIYAKVMWYDYIKFMQILKKYIINFSYLVKILIKDLKSSATKIIYIEINKRLVNITL